MRNRRTCLICSKPNSYPLCKVCKTNPLFVEEGRQILAENKDLKTLRELYGRSLVEIQNLNNRIFWDKKLDKTQFLINQDGMTEERIQISSSWIPKESTKVLDIGAGYGFLEEIISKVDNLEIYANDISGIAIEKLKKRFTGEFKVESIYNLNYKKNYFDVVFALEVLEHISPSKVFYALSNIRKILKKSGILVVSVPVNEGLEQINDNPSGHVREYTVPLIPSELKLSGFKTLNIKILYAFEHFYSFKKILSKFIKGRWKPNDVVVKAQKI
mgnify:CR=1 FL=1